MFVYITKFELVKRLKRDDFVSCILPYFSKKLKFSSFTIYKYFLFKSLSPSSIIILTNVQLISVEELEGAN